MNKSIFTDDFPELNTNEELEKTIKKFPEYDPYYVASACKKDRRELFDNLWQIYQPLADKHFLSDCKKHFHQRMWEMYLGVSLIKKGLDISSSKSGPDFIVNRGRGSEIFIEATACTKGITKDAVPEEYFAETPEEIKVQDVPYDKMLIRITNSLDSKYKKYKDHVKKEEKSYIIAVNRGALGYMDANIPLIFKCLFGLGFQSYKMINGKLFNAGWKRKKALIKESGAEIPISFFEEKEHSIVSAVIYSDISILTSPKQIGSDCILVHNHMAKYPIDQKIFSFFRQFIAKYDNDLISIKKI
jgi:hypothetical protein